MWPGGVIAGVLISHSTARGGCAAEERDVLHLPKQASALRAGPDAPGGLRLSTIASCDLFSTRPQPRTFAKWTPYHFMDLDTHTDLQPGVIHFTTLLRRRHVDWIMRGRHCRLRCIQGTHCLFFSIMCFRGNLTNVSDHVLIDNENQIFRFGRCYAAWETYRYIQFWAFLLFWPCLGFW